MDICKRKLLKKFLIFLRDMYLKTILNKKLKNYLKEEEIEKFIPNSSTVKASLAERAIRNLKQRLYRYMSQKQTLEWVSALPKIVNGINHSKSRTHGLRPIDVNFENAQEVWEKMYGPISNLIDTGNIKPKLKKDDYVRMSKNRHIFTKGYLPSWGDEILEVDKIKKQDPPIYKVRDVRGEEFKGYFYEPDLQRVKKDKTTTYRIEKEIRTKIDKNGHKKLLVKFFDDPRHYWIDESDLAPLD